MGFFGRGEKEDWTERESGRKGERASERYRVTFFSPNVVIIPAPCYK